jgi:adenosylhomocysteine nucleosidase
MKLLIMIPTRPELEAFLQGYGRQGTNWEPSRLGKLPAVHLPGTDVTAARGGYGKTQFAIHTQHLIEAMAYPDLVICAGAAGALVDHVKIGDIVVATETVEHDLRSKIGKPVLPRYAGDNKSINQFGEISQGFPFKIHFAPVASGDEDVVDAARRGEIQKLTGAAAVAWEGAGGARAAAFLKIPYLEIRAITDNADSADLSEFESNLKQAMENLAQLISVYSNTVDIKDY